jgi:hypothetical protein
VTVVNGTLMARLWPVLAAPLEGRWYSWAAVGITWRERSRDRRARCAVG